MIIFHLIFFLNFIQSVEIDSKWKDEEFFFRCDFFQCVKHKFQFNFTNDIFSFGIIIIFFSREEFIRIETVTNVQSGGTENSIKMHEHYEELRTSTNKHCLTRTYLRDRRSYSHKKLVRISSRQVLIEQRESSGALKAICQVQWNNEYQW